MDITTSKSSLHITDLFFQAEFARAAGSKAGEQWISQLASRNLDCVKDIGDSAVPKYKISSGSESRQSNTSELKDILLFYDRGLDLDKELGDRIGLLYTDAAHTVLAQSSCRKSARMGNNPIAQ